METEDIIIKGFELHSNISQTVFPNLTKDEIVAINRETKKLLLSEGLSEKIISKLEANGSDPETEKQYEIVVDLSEFGYSHLFELENGNRARFDHSKIHLSYKSVYEAMSLS